VAAWLASGVSLAGLTEPRTQELAGSLFADLWPPQLPARGWPVLFDAALDTVAMAILAMVIAVVLTVLIGPWATSRRGGGSADRTGIPFRVARGTAWLLARLRLLVLRSVPPTVWAVIALLVLFPGVLPGALALGVYTGGILGRLLAENLAVFRFPVVTTLLLASFGVSAATELAGRRLRRALHA